MRVMTLALAAALQVNFAYAENGIFPKLDNLVGVSQLLTNDFMGDGQDRWRTGSYALSYTFGDSVENGLPGRPWQLMEYRFRAEILAPENLTLPIAFPDRPYAGVLGFGAFTHFKTERFNYSFGGELVFVGPSTGLGDFQSNLHDIMNIGQPQMLADQLPDKIYPTVQGEIAHDFFTLGDRQTLIRPFVEAQAGIETYARAGVDIVFGNGFQRGFFTRDPNTGFLLSNARRGNTRNFGFMLGGDVAYVADSHLLPESRGYTVRSVRPRVRAGMVYEGDSFGLFYGATWLGREFEAQRESQVVGSVRLSLRF